MPASLGPGLRTVSGAVRSRGEKLAGACCAICFVRRPTHPLPDVEHGVLGVQVRPMSNPRSNRAIGHLLEHLNAAEFTYPGTSLKLIYSITGLPETSNSPPDQNPAGQEF